MKKTLRVLLIVVLSTCITLFNAGCSIFKKKQKGDSKKTTEIKKKKKRHPSNRVIVE